MILPKVFSVFVKHLLNIIAYLWILFWKPREFFDSPQKLNFITFSPLLLLVMQPNLFSQHIIWIRTKILFGSLQILMMVYYVICRSFHQNWGYILLSVVFEFWFEVFLNNEYITIINAMYIFYNRSSWVQN